MRNVVLCLLFALILSTCSCGLRELYKDFKVSYTNNKVNNVEIDAEIKEVNHDVYGVYFIAHSKTGLERVELTSVCLKDEEKILLKQEATQQVDFEDSQKGGFEGRVNAGEFETSTEELSGGETLYLEFGVKVEGENQTITDIVNYEIDVIQYRTLFPYY